MRTRESRYLQEIEVLRCHQLDEKAKRTRELREDNRILEAATDRVKELEARIASHKEGIRRATEKAKELEAIGRTEKRKMERQEQ